jgi:putative membrane protein insertion efficiency factor
MTVITVLRLRLSSAAMSRGVARLLLLGVRLYQTMLSPIMLVSACKFYPSCSHYAAEAIERHGARHGARLAAGRLWRCRPFTAGGYDPVPEVDEENTHKDVLDEARA